MSASPSRHRGRARVLAASRPQRPWRWTATAAVLAAAIISLSLTASAAALGAAPTATKPGAAAKRTQAAKPPALPKRCTELGIYRDDPVAAFPSLRKTFGADVTTLSTYVTAGNGLDPKLAKLARTRGLRLIVTWMPDAGTDNPELPKYSLARITGGALDTDLRALAREMKAARVPVLFRPMPEPNTPWYAWSGLTNGNSAEEYVLAWKHVRKVVRQVAGFRVGLLWSPYVRSIPETPENAIERYFPGAANVDAVGVSGYNFGTTGGLTWTDPAPLFASAYATIQALAKKPFWITETGSTSAGGSKPAWVASLGSLRAQMPLLRGIVWFDVADPNGDFRLVGPASRVARSLLEKRCIV
jgi:hypothetical protein